MLKAVLLFAAGLLCLIKGGDWFVDGAVGLAKRYGISEIIIGATIVSIGTTIPEVMVSSIAAAVGQGQTAYGNAIGSVICNTALIAALTVAVRPSAVDSAPLRLPVGFFFAAAVFYSLNAYMFGGFSRLSGIVLLLVFILYMFLCVRSAFKEPQSGVALKEKAWQEKTLQEVALNEETPDVSGTVKKKEPPLWRDILLILIGAGVIALGAELLVTNGQIIALGLGVPESVVALTFVALGTSLPELVTAVTSLIKGHSSLSLGNIVGANLFNLVFVSGLAITIRPFSIPAEKLLGGMNASLVLDIPVMFFVMAFLTLPALKKGRLYRWQGLALLAVYFSYVVFQFFI